MVHKPRLYLLQDLDLQKHVGVEVSPLGELGTR